MGDSDLAKIHVDPELAETADARFTEQDWKAFYSLTEKQRRFLIEYPLDFNGTRAAERAGYAGPEEKWQVRGSMLLRHPRVNPLLLKLTAATADEMGITREFIMHRLAEVERRVSTDKDWDPKAAIAALRTLAQLRGDMIERVDMTTRSIEIKINGADLEDLT